MTSESLDANMALILETLPEYHDATDHRRSHALTRKDAELIAAMIKVGSVNNHCSLGMNSEEAESLKKMVSERKKMLALVGAFVVWFLGYIGQKALDTFDSGFWSKLWHRVF